MQASGVVPAGLQPQGEGSFLDLGIGAGPGHQLGEAAVPESYWDPAWDSALCLVSDDCEQGMGLNSV